MATANLTDEKWRDLADEMYGDDDVQISEDAVVSRNNQPGGEAGCYVQAWVWVPNPEEREE